jgi:pimeloyl-[acyl-carrier protein] methyl ester esterase
MHIETTGQGPDLVLVHGWAMHAGIFAPLRFVLEQHYTLHLVDLPGHGLSGERDTTLDPVDAARRIAQRVPAGAIWLGWSLGGVVCLHAALEMPSAVHGLVMIAASPRFVTMPDWPHGVDASVFAQFGDELARDYRRTLDRFLALECMGSDCARAELRELRAQVFAHGEPAPRALADGLRILAETDLRARLGELRCPSLWIAGARDRLIPAGALEWAAQHAPRGAFVAIAGGGHAPFIGHPDRVLAAFAAWRDRVVA